MAAIVIGAIQFLFRKGTASHKLLGYAWVTLILMVSFTSFGIFEIRMLGPFSPIHILSILTIFSAVQAVLQARAGDVQQHKKTVARLYGLALILTGLFTLYPGRVMHAVLFG